MGLKGVVETWEGSGQDAYSAVATHLKLSVHRVETLQGSPLCWILPSLPFVMLGYKNGRNSSDPCWQWRCYCGDPLTRHGTTPETPSQCGSHNDAQLVTVVR